MLANDLIARYLQIEKTEDVPEGIEYNGEGRVFCWRFASGMRSRVDVAADEPADVMRAIAHLNEHLVARNRTALEVSEAPWPEPKPADRPV